MHWKGGCLHLFASGSVLGFAFAVSLPFMQYSVFFIQSLLGCYGAQYGCPCFTLKQRLLRV